MELGFRPPDIWESGYLIAGQYEVVRCLGIGSMGVVYLCRHRALDGFLVAVKVLNDCHLEGEHASQLRERFHNEILAARSINHPNIVRTYEHISAGCLEAYSMEYMRGGDLGQYLRRTSHLTLRNVVEMLSHMCSGAQAIHEAGFLHRDLKPSNFLLSESRQIKIADFGIARFENGPRITAKGSVVGTVHYLSPQYLETGDSCKLGDIYSLGTLAYEMVTGRLPFAGSNFFKIVEQKLRADPQPPGELNPSCPPALNDLIMKALSRKLEHRYQSAGEMAAALQEVLQTADPQSLRAGAGLRHSIGEIPDQRRHVVQHEPQVLSGTNHDGTSAGKIANLFSVRALLQNSFLQHRIASLLIGGIVLGAIPTLIAARMMDDRLNQRIATPIQLPQQLAQSSNKRLETSQAANIASSSESYPLFASTAFQSGSFDDSQIMTPVRQSFVLGLNSREGVLNAEHASSLIRDQNREASEMPSKNTTTQMVVARNIITHEEPASMVQQAVIKRHEEDNPLPSSPLISTADVVPASLQKPAHSTIVPSAEYKVRATLLYRFVDYVEWPSASLNGSTGTMRLCMYGEDPFGSFLDSAVKNVQTKQGSRLEVLRFTEGTAANALASCQVLYMGDAKRSAVETMTKSLRTHGVLVVSEDTGRGMINFVVLRKKVKFEIDVQEASRAGLKIGDVLRDLAVNVRGI